MRQLDLRGDRLHYKRLTGAGPAEGWVSLKLKARDAYLMGVFFCVLVVFLFCLFV